MSATEFAMGPARAIRFQRVRPGHFQVRDGDFSAQVWRSAYRPAWLWTVETHGRPLNSGECPTVAECREQVRLMASILPRETFQAP